MGPERALDAGAAVTKALTTSSCPSMAAENIEGRAPCAEQELRNLPSAHVRGRAERRLPVAESPIDGGIGERRLLFHQLADPFHVGVRDADGLFHDGRVLLRQPVGRSAVAGRLHRRGRATESTSGQDARPPREIRVDSHP